jgi:hypothetical protein
LLGTESARLGLLWTESERLELLWAEPRDLCGTAAAAAEGGRDTRVLGDPMDLIRCQKLPGKAQWHTVQTSTN